jgi:phospholipase C
MRSHWRAVVLVCLLVAVVTAAPASAKKAKIRGVDHIVVVMMENRSFDHLLGWHPTADAKQAGLSYQDDAGIYHPTAELAPDYQGCSHSDPGHSWQDGRIDLDNGRMDGFLFNNCGQADPTTAASYCPRQTTNDQYTIGYYGESDRPFFNALARNYTTLDHFHSSILAETFPNRIFSHAAQTDRLTNTLTLATVPTIWDELIAKKVSAKYYFSDASFLALWGTKYDSISHSYDEFLSDAAAGDLPRVAFVEPRFVGEEQGLTNDDHPHADVRAGDAFLSQTFRAVSSGPDWPTTVFIVVYDEWGGFFDHVAPPRAAAPNDVDPDLVDGKALLGMRVPAVVASALTLGDPANPRVVSTTFDHTSILKLIEWRWGLAALTARDASSDVGNLNSVLNFSNTNSRVPSMPSPAPPPVVECPSPLSTSASRAPELGDLAAMSPSR